MKPAHSSALDAGGGSISPKAAVVRTIDAINDSKIIIALKSPKALNKPIGDVAIIANPAISESAEPTSARAQAPPTPYKAWR